MDFSDLHWTESSIERIEVSGRTLSVVASGVLVLGSHLPPCRVRVDFIDVARVTRGVTEYLGTPVAPAGFRPEYLVQDLSPIETSGNTAYGLEGISTFDPIAWLDIEVLARTAQVTVL